MGKVMVIILLLLALAVGAVLGLFFLFREENAWLCQNGNWVKHGDPAGAKPTLACPTNKNTVVNTTHNTNSRVNNSNNINASSSMPVSLVLDTGIIYDQTVDSRLLPLIKEDCQKRGGIFNECGSPCAPSEGACITLCAYTCDFDRRASQKYCDSSSDCGLLACGGCFAESYLKKAPPDLSCQQFSENYLCQCVSHRCVEIVKDRPLNFPSIQTEKDCQALEAEWVNAGKLLYCEKKASDAGKTCAKSTDCLRHCALEKASDLTGKCAAHSGSGCYLFLDDQGKTKSLCVD